MANGTAKRAARVPAAGAAFFMGLLAIGAFAGAGAATFVVDSAVDAIDNNPGDGVCAVDGGGCTLRAAVMQANALAGADVIDLTGMNNPLEPITLSLAGDGPDEIYVATAGTPPYELGGVPDASVGDLDILDDVTIQGAGPGLTVVRWAAGSPADRVFHLQAPAGGTVTLISISDLTVTGGSVITDIIEHITCDGGPAAAEAPTEGPPVPPTEGDWVLKRFGGGIAIGPGAGVGNTCESGGGEGGMPPDVGPPEGGEEEETGGIEAVEFTRLVVAGNVSGSDGGGIHVAAPLTLSGSIIANNLSGANGGGLYLDTGILIEDTTIGKIFDPLTVSYLTVADPTLLALVQAGNVAENGGGIFDTGSHTTTINDSALNGNQATGGGAIAGRALITINITNSTVSNNSAKDVGGGITTNGTVNLVNATVAENLATTDAAGGGGGLNSFGSGTFIMTNTLIAGNVMGGGEGEVLRDQNCGCTGTETCAQGRFVTQGGNLEDADYCDLGQNDLRNTDPLLMPLAYYGGFTETHALPDPVALGGTGSPAVDAGVDSACPNNDQRGILRSDDGDLNESYLCDIGAFELFIPRADLHVNNATAPNTIGKGTQFELHVEVHNDLATVLAEGVSVQVNVPGGLDVLQAQWAHAGGVLSGCDVAGGPVVCDIGDMQPTGIADVWLQIQSNGAVIYNGPPVSYELPVALHTTTLDLVPGNNLASPKVKVLGKSNLSLVGQASAVEVDAMQPVTLSYTITNAGEDFASTLDFGLSMPAGMNVVSATPDVGTCNQSGTAIRCALGGLAAGAGSLGVQLVLEPQLAGALVFEGIAGAEQIDSDMADNSVTMTVTSIAVADLVLSGRANRSAMNTGDNVTVSLTVTNVGPLASGAFSVSGQLPTGVSFVTGNGCALASGTVTCAAGSLATGASKTFDMVLTATTTGTKTTSVSLTADTKDPVPSNDSATISFSVSSPPSGGGGGGCVSNPDAPIDPTLIILLALALAGLLARQCAARYGRA